MKYRPFHKTLPRSSAFVHWISVRFYGIDCRPMRALKDVLWYIFAHITTHLSQFYLPIHNKQTFHYMLLPKTRASNLPTIFISFSIILILYEYDLYPTMVFQIYFLLCSYLSTYQYWWRGGGWHMTWAKLNKYENKINTTKQFI